MYSLYNLQTHAGVKLLLIFTFLPFFAMTQISSTDFRKDQPCTGKEISLELFQWENRILVLFASHSDDETYQTQMDRFSSLEGEFRDRDLILISVFNEECSSLNGEVISDSSSQKIRERLSPPENGYSILLIGKDGGVKLKQDEVLEPAELFRVIDRMPMRQREMREGG
ncbi:DUF4174 domain-containing protein [Rhodohalobacter sp.]|uniref:DUF4174 domain-containing protein n=1 Tax=Rhodohalobacter sp. TaxID=1974210 RepID=UPI003567437B